MLGVAKFYLRVAQLVVLRRLVSQAQVTRDYDRISVTYDDYFSSRVASASEQMISRLGLQPHARVADLASGTGTLSLAAARAVGPGGRVTGFDRSVGMLEIARRKAEQQGLVNVSFKQGDMQECLEALDDESLDAVTCGWAIGYVDPSLLLRVIRQKLKPGGVVGIIENTRGTLAPIRKTCCKVAAMFPSKVSRLMDLHFRLPRGSSHLRSLLKHATLTPIDLWENRVVSEFHSGADVLNWVLHTGAGAGFSSMMAEEAAAECDEQFIRIIENDFMVNGTIEVAHCYVAGTAKKGT